MSRVEEWSRQIDVVLVIIAIVTLSVSLWIWIIALPIPRETVFLAATIALVISFVLIISVAILVVLRLQRRVTTLEGIITAEDEVEVVTEAERAIVVTLSNTERRIINQLEAADGNMTQDELRRSTGLSKSTLSVTLSNLERKSVVTRETSGRTKIVNLIRRVER